MMRLARVAELVRVLVRQAGVGTIGDDPHRRRRGLLQEGGRAIVVASTRWILSSVERSTRDTSDVSTMVATNHAAIFTPSGRSTMFTTVV